MHDTAPRGASQTAPLAGQSGDVDADGQILDALRRRLDAAIGEDVEHERERHLERVLRVCTWAKARTP